MTNSPSNFSTESTSNDMVVGLHDATCSWSSSDEEEHSLVLDHVSLSVPKGSFITIVGEVESSFLTLFSIELIEKHF